MLQGMLLNKSWRYIWHLKTTVVADFGVYQKLEFGTVKWHMLYNVSDDMIQNGGLFLCEESISYNSKTFFKQSNETTPKRRVRAIDDAIVALDLRLTDDERKQAPERPKHKTVAENEQELLRLPRIKAYEEDTSCASGDHMTLKHHNWNGLRKYKVIFY